MQVLHRFCGTEQMCKDQLANIDYYLYRQESYRWKFGWQFGLGYENLKLYIAQYIPTCQLDSSKAMIHVETVEFFTISANWLKRHLLLL